MSLFRVSFRDPKSVLLMVARSWWHEIERKYIPPARRKAGGSVALSTIGTAFATDETSPRATETSEKNCILE